MKTHRVLLVAVASAASLLGVGLWAQSGGVMDPILIRDTRPTYTSKAKDAKIEGDVELEATVQPNGKLSDVKVTKSLDSQYGLDQEAIKCAEQRRFKPGTRQGKPVPVNVTLVIQFRLPVRVIMATDIVEFVREQTEKDWKGTKVVVDDYVARVTNDGMELRNPTRGGTVICRTGTGPTSSVGTSVSVTGNIEGVDRLNRTGFVGGLIP